MLEKYMYEDICKKADIIENRLVDLRRDIHMHPETAWKEMRTSALIAENLEHMGYEVISGKEVCDDKYRMGVPTKDELKAHVNMLEENNLENYCSYITDDMKAGYTGVIGLLKCGEGPTIALRFDIDALPMEELHTSGHRPHDLGFDSVFPCMMHSCGHDCHIVIGLGVAKILSDIKGQIHGTVKLIFRPSEEGTRGAYSIVKKGHLDNVDYFASGHVSYKNEEDDFDLIPGSFGALATCKYKVTFKGLSAHAGRAPEEGNSAVLCAANAVTALVGIQRHSEGISRINVGSIHGGSGCNIVPDEAYITLEVRGATDKINDFMSKRVEEICNGAAIMQGCTCIMELLGKAPSQRSDEDFSDMIASICTDKIKRYKLSDEHQFKNSDSEDVGFMMNHVQENGGKAVYLRLMTKMASPQHTIGFDVDEKVIKCGVIVYSSVIYTLLKKINN